jgi:mannose-6-phosphate isomerase-like protein (cupin superfamily)
MRPILFLLAMGLCVGPGSPSGFILEHERDLARPEKGPHDGKGSTVAYNFFSSAPGLALVFRKRVLLPGASIGYHLQKEDEIYYVIRGRGLMRMNDSSFEVETGDAVLTRPGSWHGVEAQGDTLVLLINYLQGK